MAASTTTTVLPYADLPARWGVAVERDADRLRIVVPPIPGWRHLATGFHVSILLLAAITAAYGAALVRALVRGPTRPDEIMAYSMGASVWGLPLLIVVAIAMQRLRSRAVLEVDSAHLII